MFPNQARAAVSMTYDDGMSQHLDYAAPDLESNGLVGTFYVPTGGKSDDVWHSRRSEWSALAARGHEIGNHTRVHPCRNPSWDGPNLVEYTLEQITAELKLAQRELADAIGDQVRSFAYPCSNTTVGPDSAPISYVDVADELFPASRIVANVSADPATVDLRLVPSLVMTQRLPVTRAIELLDEAIAGGKWIVYTFHGVGGGHMNYDRESHQELCKAIAARGSGLFCGTFVDVASMIRRATGKSWQPATGRPA
jgi:peptidoglycan-N-acetylglucosamine deacetylase